MNPIYWQVMARRNRGFYGNADGQQIGFTQNGDSYMGRYDQQMRGDNQHNNHYPGIDDDRIRNAQRGGYGGNGQQMNGGYNGSQMNGDYQQGSQRDFQIRKGGM